MPSTATAPQASTFLEGATIVLRGNFNPAIVSPSWLLHQELIGQDDFDSQMVEIINSSVAVYSTGWLTCHVTDDRLQLGVVDAADFERLRDLAVGVLNTLPHTPISSLGINRETHLQIREARVWHAIGDLLLPKTFWVGTLNFPGMRSVAVEGVRGDNLDGRIIIQVEPSVRVVPRIYVAHNDHYNLVMLDSPITERQSLVIGSDMETQELLIANSKKLRMAIEILNDQWRDSMHKATMVFNKIKELAREIS